MSDAEGNGWMPVGRLDELRERRVVVVLGEDRPVAVYADGESIFAVDNRCPHLGFPLHQGSVKDGVLTCHWHEARFDLASGCTFDLWADDVPAYDTRVRDGVVYVAKSPRRRPSREYYARRLQSGLEHDIALVQAKGILGLNSSGAEPIDAVRQIARFGSRNHDDWGEGMTLLAIVANLSGGLSSETHYYALARAAAQVASDSSGAAPHRPREPLDPSDHDSATLKRWLRDWVRCRHRDAAERVLLTAIERSETMGELSDLVFTAACDRIYAQQGHVFDLMNKAFELSDRIGREHAAELLPLVLERMTSARGAEEDAHWHHPIELVEPLRRAEGRIAEQMASGRGKRWSDDGRLVETLLGEDPLGILDALGEALAAGAPAAELSKRVAYAAAVRLARFSMSNEVADWFNPRHTFTYANAVDQAVKREASPEVVRAVYHGALSVYHDRFLNVPPARLPGKKDVADLPTDAQELRASLLAALDRRADVETAGRIVARYVRLGYAIEPLFDTLTFATFREDLDFHAAQVLEAGARQVQQWAGGPEVEHILIGVVRQLAAFCPTPRAGLQTATIALRLHRGDRIYEEETA